MPNPFPLFVLTIVGSVLVVGVTAAIGRGRLGAKLVGLFCVVAALCPFPILFVQLLVTCLAALAWKPCPSKWKAMCVASVMGMVVNLTLVGFFAHDVHQKAQAVIEMFPLESVTDRLAYEIKATAVPFTLSGQVERRLSQFEHLDSANTRREMLKTLHDQKRSEFRIAFGFGNSRLILPVKEPIPLPSKPPSDAETPVDVARPNEVALQSLHETGFMEFIDPSRLGYIQDRDHVAGFVPHRFTYLPTDFLEEPVQEQWTMTRLELVSLLKHEVPVAYVSEHLPQMDELRDAPTRPLDDFEQRALDQLRSDEDLVIDDAHNRIRMVGSLRAGKDCMECHSVRRGELLGAFSYELIGGRPVPVKENIRSRGLESAGRERTMEEKPKSRRKWLQFRPPVEPLARRARRPARPSVRWRCGERLARPSK